MVQRAHMELKKAANRILDQLILLISTLNDKEYTQPLIVLSNATLGQHIRHTLEFFICLKNGMNVALINYDKREHDKTIEKDRKIALSIINEISEFLEQFHTDEELLLELSYGENEEEVSQIKSNFSRELAYNIEHGVHHMAIIKIGALALRPTLELPTDFGVASSTLRYRNKQQTSSV